MLLFGMSSHRWISFDLCFETWVFLSTYQFMIFLICCLLFSILYSVLLSQSKSRGKRLYTLASLKINLFTKTTNGRENLRDSIGTQSQKRTLKYRRWWEEVEEIALFASRRQSPAYSPSSDHLASFFFPPSIFQFPRSPKSTRNHYYCWTFWELPGGLCCHNYDTGSIGVIIVILYLLINSVSYVFCN